MKKQTYYVIGGGIAFLGLIGYIYSSNQVKKLKESQLTLEKISIDKLYLNKPSNLSLLFSIKNPSKIKMKIYNFDIDVILRDNKIGEIKDKSVIEIPGNGKKDFVLNLSFDLMKNLNTLLSLPDFPKLKTDSIENLNQSMSDIKNYINGIKNQIKYKGTYMVKIAGIISKKMEIK